METGTTNGTRGFYQACFMISFNTPEKYMDSTPDVDLDNLYISKVKTSSCKQTIAYTAAILWDNIHTYFKDLSQHLKLYLLSEQHSENK